MNSLNGKAIKLSKGKIVLLILGSCAFLVLGGFFLILDDATIQSQPRTNSPLLVHTVGFIAVVFSGATGVFGVKKLFDNRPGLILNSSGIIDNSSGVSAGLIPWTEILGSEIQKIGRQRFLVIKVRNPQKYIERGGALKRVVNRANNRLCGSPIAIASTALNVKFSELVKLFDEYKQRYGNA